METRKTTNQEQEIMEFLNELRDSGTINMFGATSYIQNEYPIEKQEATRILKLWMNNFNSEGDYKTVKATA